VFQLSGYHSYIYTDVYNAREKYTGDIKNPAGKNIETTNYSIMCPDDSGVDILNSTLGVIL